MEGGLRRPGNVERAAERKKRCRRESNWESKSKTLCEARSLPGVLGQHKGGEWKNKGRHRRTLSWGEGKANLFMDILIPSINIH